MGLTSDAGDDGDVSHNPDAWTPLDFNAMELPPPADDETSNHAKNKTKKHKDKEDTLMEFEAFGNASLFQNLDADGFQIASDNDKNAAKPAPSETTTTTAASDVEAPTKPIRKKKKKPPRQESNKSKKGGVEKKEGEALPDNNGDVEKTRNKSVEPPPEHKPPTRKPKTKGDMNNKSGHSTRSGHSKDPSTVAGDAPPKKRKKKKPQPATTDTVTADELIQR
jgi:hypothetical protein